MKANQAHDVVGVVVERITHLRVWKLLVDLIEHFNSGVEILGDFFVFRAAEIVGIDGFFDKGHKRKIVLQGDLDGVVDQGTKVKLGGRGHEFLLGLGPELFEDLFDLGLELGGV